MGSHIIHFPMLSPIFCKPKFWSVITLCIILFYFTACPFTPTIILYSIYINFFFVLFLAILPSSLICITTLTASKLSFLMITYILFHFPHNRCNSTTSFYAFILYHTVYRFFLYWNDIYYEMFVNYFGTINFPQFKKKNSF